MPTLVAHARISSHIAFLVEVIPSLKNELQMEDDYKKVIDKIIHNRFTSKCMAAKNEYSRIHYNATSLLIVMLSAHEIKVYPLNG